MARAITASFSYEDSAENSKIFKLIDELANKDARSRSWLIMEAIKEYLANHYPGNPQTDLRTFIGEMAPKGSREARKLVEGMIKDRKH